MNEQPSIQSIGHPIVYKAKLPADAQVTLSTAPDTVAVLAEMRALEGMQKEAIIHYGDTVWRMVSDEGPYLNGTDLAPFPLAFYTAGMAFSFMTELLRHAKAEEVEIRSIKTIQDNFYTMEGSALRGDMIGGAKPVEISADIDTDAPEALISKIMMRAEATSPAQAYMRDALTNTFSLCLNGKRLDVKRVAASPGALHDDPAPKFDQISPQADDLPEIVTKLEAAQQVFGVEGGAGSSLQSEQKRTLHVRGITTLREDGMKEAHVQLFKPIGSTFRFLCDDAADEGGLERAPAPLAYLTAGVGFCYMTQLGRYAHIMKQELEAYRMVQQNIYKLAGPNSPATNEPVDTHVYINFGEPDEAAQQLVNMGEQTCFLHAAMRASVPSIIRA